MSEPSKFGSDWVTRVFAEQEETVLISGPTGAGKSRMARWCHEQSSRKGNRFETLDLMSTPDELQMAELFGWKRGAFTGAVKDSIGAMGRAAEGTLFIDEIDKLSLKTQAGLLRVIEEGTYRPLGDESPEKQAKVRFIVGTNADLRACVKAKKFREDLYYRINVLPARLPPLSERLDELPLWAEYMLTRRHRDSERSGTARIERDGVEVLLNSPWPGNLRQLDNIIRRAYALALSNLRGTTGDVVLGMRHLKSALEYDGVPEETAIINQLWRVAHAFVREAEQRQDSGTSMTLEMIEAMRGLVLAAAVAFWMLCSTVLVSSFQHVSTCAPYQSRATSARSFVYQRLPAPIRNVTARLYQNDCQTNCFDDER